MNTKIYATILAAVFLLELSTARTIRHHETIIKSNGDKIVRSWTTHEGDDTEQNSNNNFISNVFEDGKEGANEHIFMTTNFGLPTPVFDKPGYTGVKNKFEVPQRKSQTGMENGQFEEAWDLEPDFKASIDTEPEPLPVPELEPQPETQPHTHPEPEPSEAEHNWKSLSDLAKQPNSAWKPINSNTNVNNNDNGQSINDPWHMLPPQTNSFGHAFISNGIESWPVIQQQPTEQQNPTNFNGATHVTHTYTLKPTQFTKTDSFSMPQTIFTGNWDIFGGWTALNENPKQYSWQDEVRKSYPAEDERTVQYPKNNYNPKPTAAVKPAKYPNKTLEELLNELYGETQETTITPDMTTTSAPPSTTKTHHKPITTINIEDLPIADILNNGEPIDEDFLKTLPEHLRPYEDTVGDIRGSYNVKNIPMAQESDTRSLPSYIPLPALKPPPPTPRTGVPPPHNTTTLKPQAASYQSNIAKFLDKVGLSVDDILFKTAARTVTKTIVDDNGDILTATFMLSSVKDRNADSNKDRMEVKPLK